MKHRSGPVSLRAAVALAVALLPGGAVAAPVSIGVDWAKPTGKEATTLQYGMNLYKGSDPRTTTKDAYKAGLALMRPGLMRLHHAGLAGDSTGGSGLVASPTTAEYRWDAAKIEQAVSGLPRDAVWMINIPAWPRFLGSSNMPLPVENVPAFAKFCADLVKIVNVDLKRGFRYFEVLNERDDVYKGRVPEMVALIRAASMAMKAVDPTIKVGGPAFIQPWHANVKAFVEGSADFIDFLSYHTYQTGSATSSTPSLLKGALGLGGATSWVRGFIPKTNTRTIELFHDEFNISYAPPDARMNNDVGAVFDALVLISVANAGATGSAAWNEADGWYGKLDGSLRPRPAAYVFRLFNAFMLGAIATTTTSASDIVTPFAVSAAGRRALALVNREEAEAQVTLAPTGPGAENVKWNVHQVTAAGLKESTLEGMTIALPPRSITVLAQGAPAQVLPPVPDAGAAPSLDAAAAPDAGVVADAAPGIQDARQPTTPDAATTPNPVNPTPPRRDAAPSPAPTPEDPDQSPGRPRSGGCAVGGEAPTAAMAAFVALLLLAMLRRSRAPITAGPSPARARPTAR